MLKFKSSNHKFEYSILEFCSNIDEAIEKAILRSKLTNDEILGVYMKHTGTSKPEDREYQRRNYRKNG